MKFVLNEGVTRSSGIGRASLFRINIPRLIAALRALIWAVTIETPATLALISILGAGQRRRRQAATGVALVVKH